MAAKGSLIGKAHAPIPSSAAVSRRMSQVRTRNTGPEVRLRSALHRRGLRYRLGVRIPSQPRCSPDVVFARAKVAVFLNGCYWHGCRSHASWPKSNAEWWREKIEQNRRRDRSVDATLRSAGWKVLRIWEHEDPETAASKIEKVVVSRLGTEAGSGSKSRSAK